MSVCRRIVLRFPKNLVEKPLVYHLVKDYDLKFNILRAKITPEEEGLLSLEIKGDKNNYSRGIDFLTKSGVTIEQLGQKIRKNEDLCTQCGLCVSVCPTPALAIDRKSREVIFDSNHCVTCEMCIKVCPVKAMEIKFD
ncbi:MAG: 4Fe-4S binding protein [bacterium]|nr:4Fe-4S binding protein [bacterium]